MQILNYTDDKVKIDITSNLNSLETWKNLYSFSQYYVGNNKPRRTTEFKLFNATCNLSDKHIGLVRDLSTLGHATHEFAFEVKSKGEWYFFTESTSQEDWKALPQYDLDDLTMLYPQYGVYEYTLFSELSVPEIINVFRQRAIAFNSATSIDKIKTETKQSIQNTLKSNSTTEDSTMPNTTETAESTVQPAPSIKTRMASLFGLHAKEVREGTKDAGATDLNEQLIKATQKSLIDLKFPAWIAESETTAVILQFVLPFAIDYGSVHVPNERLRENLVGLSRHAQRGNGTRVYEVINKNFKAVFAMIKDLPGGDE